MSEKELEERRSYIRGLSEKERFILSNYGEDYLEKWRELQQLRKEESETQKQKLIEETKTLDIEEIMTEILDKIDAKPRAKKKIGKLVQETVRLRERIDNYKTTVRNLEDVLDSEERAMNFEVSEIFKIMKNNNPKLYESLKKYIAIMTKEGILEKE